MYDAGDDALILSHPTTFEQLEVSGETFGAQRRFLADGAFVDVLSHDGEVVGVQLPDEIRATVVETDPRFKGESKDGESNDAAALSHRMHARLLPRSPTRTHLLRTFNPMLYRGW